ncbi:MAG: GntR family transcriptional regulator [Zavarzinia sp.]|nr:GntR family transcriptional regulator [Zavarzinia sp.]
MATSKGRRAIEVKRSAPDSPPLPFPDAPGEEGDGTKTLAELAYRRIRDLIIAGDLAPDEKLRIEYLRRALDIGASPLREALSRLSSHGIVEMEGQRGFRVASVSLPALWDITETRLLLEAMPCGAPSSGATIRGRHRSSPPTIGCTGRSSAARRLPAERDLAHEHRAIMDAALARNADEACRLSDEHIMRTAMAIAAILAGQSPRSTPSTA